MPDVVDTATRSRMMAGIKGKNTKPELVLRRLLHAKGFRYRLHAPKVPGKPDMVFRAYNAAVFVHGCFWHGHDCRLFRIPGTRPEFWGAKIERNRARDHQVREQLESQGWRQLVVWECSMRGQSKDAPSRVADKIEAWLKSKVRRAELRGA